MDRSGSQFGEGDAKVREASGHEGRGVLAAMGGAESRLGRGGHGSVRRHIRRRGGMPLLAQLKEPAEGLGRQSVEGRRRGQRTAGAKMNAGDRRASRKAADRQGHNFVPKIDQDLVREVRERIHGKVLAVRVVRQANIASKSRGATPFEPALDMPHTTTAGNGSRREEHHRPLATTGQRNGQTRLFCESYARGPRRR